MSIYSRRRSKRRSQSHYGHLKLSVQEDSGALAVTIYEARGLKRRDGASLDTYAKLYMLPDPEKRTKEKTRRVKEKDPVFNQKFNFLLNDERDYKKRLFVSVWNRERAGRSDMIGCMTFNVSDLLSSTGVRGWYQLLEEEKGRKENVAVPSTAMIKAGSLSSLGSTSSAPTSSMSKNFAVTLVRSPKGYGFKVTVGTPVYIDEVTEGLPAHQSDIHKGDMILEVEGTDVTRANGEMVANMIRKQRDTLQMILIRNGGPISPPSGIMGTSASRAFYSHSLNDLADHAGIGGLRRQIPSFSSSQTTSGRLGSPEGRYHQAGLLTQPADISYSQVEDPSWLNTVPSSNFRVTKSTKDRLPEVPEEHSGIEKPGLCINGLSKSNSQSSQRSGGGGSEEVLNHQPLSIGHLSFSQPGGLDAATRHHHGGQDARKHSLGSPYEENKGLYELALTSMRSKTSSSGGGGPSYSSRSRSKFSNSSSGSVEDSSYSTGHSSRSLNQLQQEEPPISPTSPFGLTSRGKSPPMDTALQKISPTSPATCSESSGQRSMLLEERINFVDWEGLNRLEQKRQRYLNSLLKCEKELYDELKKGVDMFLNPLCGVISENSHRTIFMNLDRMYDLSKYFYLHFCQRAVQCVRAPSNVSCYIEEFADFYHNKLHLLVKILEAYLRNSENARKEIAVCFTNPDFQRTVREPSQLYSFVEAGTEYLPKMCRLLTGISYLTPLDHQDHQHLTEIINALMNLLPQSCTDLVKSWKGEKDIMENLKSAITFPSNGVESFDIVKPGRVLLHEGEAHLLEKKKKRKVWLLLFSDILLVTKRTRHMLCVMEPPIQLGAVIMQDINCAGDEFQLSTEDGSISRQFRVVSNQERAVWIQKLKERATGSLKRSLSKQHIGISMKQVVLRTQLEQELKTPYRLQRKTSTEDDSHIFADFESEDVSCCVNLATQFDSNNDERTLTQIPPPDHIRSREFVPPQPSVVFPLSQPILPSKFSTLPNKKPQVKQQSRKISAVLKRRSADLSNGLSQLSQGSFGFSGLSPSFSKRYNYIKWYQHVVVKFIMMPNKYY